MLLLICILARHWLAFVFWQKIFKTLAGIADLFYARASVMIYGVMMCITYFASDAAEAQRT
jgi:hypothetical protein